MPLHPLVMVGAGVIGLVALAALVVALVALGRSRQRPPAVEGSVAERMMAALQAGDGDTAATELADYMQALEERMQRAERTLAALREWSSLPVQRIGMVHFDAADDIGGKVSCALAALDARSNGFLITSLYTRERSRTFVRQIAGGKTRHELLPEEAEALRQALSGAGEGEVAGGQSA